MKRLVLVLAIGGFLTAIATVSVADFGYDVKTRQMSQKEVEKIEKGE
jgi:hypothetical protein